MESFRRFSVLVCCILILSPIITAQGPVFINPNSPVPVSATSDVNQGNYVTQTVYGFLDFTTTIGNTVMVFSPQSAAAAVPEVPKIPNDITSNNVIETKPLAPKKDEIQPTKTITSKSNKPSSEEKMSSVVNVQTEKPSSIVSQVKSVPSTKLDANRASAVVGKQSGIVSKVEVVVEGSPSSKPKPNIITKVEVISGPTELAKQEAIIASRVEVVSNEPTNIISSVVQVKSDEEPAAIIGNNIGEPEYDFLSRQPSEVVEETYKVVNLRPSSKFILRHRPSTEAKKNVPTKKPGAAHPTGLVTKLGGTVVKDGITTVIETSVIGTYISGKYAQVLQSSSKKINPTQSQRILKTAAPSLDSSVALDAAQNTIKSTRKASGGFKRFKNRHKETDASIEDNNDQEVAAPTQPNYKKSQKNRAQSTSRGSKHHTSSTHSSQKHGRKRGRTTTTPKPYVNSEETTASTKRYSSGRRNKQGRASTTPSQPESSGGFSRRAFKPKVQASNVEQTPSTTTSSLYKFKLNRSPGRWQYKTTPKPRVTIRKQNIDEFKEENTGTTASAPQQEPVAPAANEVVTPQARSDDLDSLEGSESIASVVDDTSTSNNKLEAPAFPVETLKVEISTPPDFGDIYYEIATIKSPYTFQVGSVKNTRYITVTSTFEKSLEPSIEPTSIKPSEPLTENILATTSNYKDNNNILDSSIATLPPLFLASDMETPPLETVTETFSTTQTMLKTHILPVIRYGNETSSSTLVQTFVITRLVTATKTLPPMEAYQFIPSKTLNEFNSHLDEAGSELHLELEFGDENDEDGGQIRKISLPSDLDLANIGSNLDLSDDDKVKLMEAHLKSKKNPTPKHSSQPQQQHLLNPEQLQQLALYRLLNPQAAQGQVITTSKPVVKVETLFETFILPITQGHNTIQSTISKIKGTVTKTDYEYGTSTIAPALPIPQIPQLPPQIPQLPQLTPQLPQLNPYLPQPQLVVTSSPVVQSTSITQTNSKVLKLTFGAKTAHTTVYSTTVIPTLLTTYITQSVPVAPTAAYPGYFPAPFPPYPYVG